MFPLSHVLSTTASLISVCLYTSFSGLTEVVVQDDVSPC